MINKINHSKICYQYIAIIGTIIFILLFITKLYFLIFTSVKYYFILIQYIKYFNFL